MPPRVAGQRAASIFKSCQYCNREYRANGLTAHEKACVRKQAAQAQDAAFEQRVNEGRSRVPELPPQLHEQAYYHDHQPAGPSQPDPADIEEAAVADMGAGAAVADHNPGLKPDDIKVEYHPNSGRQPVIHHFEDYGRKNSDDPDLPVEREPWRPFESRLDYEVAELALEAALNQSQTERLIKLVQRAANKEDKFSICNQADLQYKWKVASVKHTPVCIVFS